MNWEFLKSKKLLLGILLILIFVVSAEASYLILNSSRISTRINPALTPFPSSPAPTPSPQPTTDENQLNFLLLGAGGVGHNGANLTDSIILVNVNQAKKKVNLISIPRDLQVPGNYKINAALTNVGPENLKGVVQNITGLKVDKYILVDFSGFTKIIDSLGGIEIDNPAPYDDYFYPVKGLENETCGKDPAEIAELHQKYSGFELEKQFTCRYEHIHFDKGIVKLDGANSLKFVRSRHGDSDFGRSRRQFMILKGIKEKLISLNAMTKIDEIFTGLSKMVKTDLDLKTVKELIGKAGNHQDYQVQAVQLTDENVLTSKKGPSGEYILIPKAGSNNFSEIQNFLKSF